VPVALLAMIDSDAPAAAAVVELASARGRRLRPQPGVVDGGRRLPAIADGRQGGARAQPRKAAALAAAIAGVSPRPAAPTVRDCLGVLAVCRRGIATSSRSTPRRSTPTRRIPYDWTDDAHPRPHAAADGVGASRSRRGARSRGAGSTSGWCPARTTTSSPNPGRGAGAASCANA
jgi:hypothetical protein